MKSGKLYAAVLATMMLTSAIAGVTGCGSQDNASAKSNTEVSSNAETDNTTETEETSEQTEAGATYKIPTSDVTVWQGYEPEQYEAEDVSTKEIAYQFVTYYSNEKNISIMVNLYEDGFARMTQYSEGRQGVIDFYYYGYWTSMDDDYIYLNFSCYSWAGEDDPDNGMANGDICTVDYAYELRETDGVFAFSLNACLGFADGGVYVRSADVTSDGSVQYQTEEEFVKYADDFWANFAGTETEAGTEEN